MVRCGFFDEPEIFMFHCILERNFYVLCIDFGNIAAPMLHSHIVGSDQMVCLTRPGGATRHSWVRLDGVSPPLRLSISLTRR